MARHYDWPDEPEPPKEPTAKDRVLEDMLDAAQDLKTDPDSAHLRLIKLAEEAQKLDALEEQRAKEDEVEEVRVVGWAGDETWVKRRKNAKERRDEIVEEALKKDFSKTEVLLWAGLGLALLGWLLPFFR